MPSPPSQTSPIPPPERFIVSVDVVVLTLVEDRLHTLLLRRTEPPFQDHWALPGGTVRREEDLPAAVHRVMHEKAGLGGVYLEQLYTFSEPARDPRDRALSVAHLALVDPARLVTEVPGARITPLHIPWEGETGGPVAALSDSGTSLPLAFDHGEILGLAVKRVRGKLNYSPVGFQLLPEAFTLHQLQKVHQGILGRPLNKDAFRRRMLATGQLEPTGESQSDVDHRPAALYRFTGRSAI